MNAGTFRVSIGNVCRGYYGWDAAVLGTLRVSIGHVSYVCRGYYGCDALTLLFLYSTMYNNDSWLSLLV